MRQVRRRLTRHPLQRLPMLRIQRMEQARPRILLLHPRILHPLIRLLPRRPTLHRLLITITHDTMIEIAIAGESALTPSVRCDLQLDA
jgi:hypothetical protein